MTTIITRLYAGTEQATAVAKQLRTNRSWRDSVNLVTPAGDSGKAGKTYDEIVSAICAGGLYQSDAVVYAEGIRQGRALVTVSAPFGTAGHAMRLMDKFEPVPSGVSRTEHYQGASIGPAPLSALFNWPVLSNDPTPFSSFWNLSTISGSSVRSGRSWRNTRMLPFPTLSRSGGRVLPFPTLSRSSKPASSIWRSRGPIFPFPTLMKDRPRRPRRSGGA